MEKIIKLLHSGNYSCVICSNNETHTFSKPGVADLYELVKGRSDILKESSLADKVVGKAAAALMILGGVKKVYADVISSPALDLLKNAGIEPVYESLVPHIENRDKTDWCPLEKMCTNESTPETILPKIDEFIAKMREIRMGVSNVNNQ